MSFCIHKYFKRLLLDSPSVTVSYTLLGTQQEEMEEDGKISIIEGDSVWILCESTANPPANIVWKKVASNTKVIGNEEELLLSNITRDAEGKYSCTAENSFGRSSASLELKVLCQYTMNTISVN